MAAFTVLHVVISLVGIGTGFVVLADMLARRQRESWTAWFLATTVLTSVTGFGFPADRVLPSHILAVLSLAVLAVAIYARYIRQLSGNWQATYVVTALAAQYFNVFVLVVQSFQKIPALKVLAPTQTEPLFGLTHVVVLAAFLVGGYRALGRIPKLAEAWK